MPGARRHMAEAEIVTDNIPQQSKSKSRTKGEGYLD